MIDPNKPMEFTDGTPVVLNPLASQSDYKCSDRVAIRVAGDGPRAGSNYVYCLKSGKHAYAIIGSVLRNVPEPTLDLAGDLQTADGKPVKLVSTLADRLVVEVFYKDTYGLSTGIWCLEYRNLDGRINKQPGRTSGDDLVNKVEPTVETFLNLYADGSTGKTRHISLVSAVNYCKVGKQRVGIITLTTKGGKYVSAELKLGTPYTRQSPSDVVGIF